MGRAMTQPTTEEILIEYGVHLGFGEKRKELARQLESAIPEEELEKIGLGEMDVGGALTGLDLKMVCNHVEDEGAAKTAGARIAWVLGERNRWGPLLADLRQFHKIRLAREPKADPFKGETNRMYKPWQSGVTLAERIYFRVTRDQQDPHDVADEFGVTMEKLNELLDHEAKRQKEIGDASSS